MVVYTDCLVPVLLQEQLLLIRMQWWKDAVKSAYGDKPEPNPVIQALHQVLS